MNKFNKNNLSKNDIKSFIRKKLYIALKRIFTQINAQLDIYSERSQIIDQNKWHRLIDGTFKRNLRDAHKEIKLFIEDDTYWNKYNECIIKLIDYIKQQPIRHDIEDTKTIIFEVWGGLPKFELNSIGNKKYLSYIVFKNFLKNEITKVGCILLSLRRRNQPAEMHVNCLREITDKVFRKYKIFPERQLLIYFNSYGEDIFPFKFKAIGKDKKNTDDELIDEIDDKKQGLQINENLTDEIEWVGKLIQSQKKPMRQGKGTRKVEDIVIEGWLYEDHCHLAEHNRFFVAQDPNLGTKDDNKVREGHRRQLLIKINDFKDWSQNVAHEISDDPKLGHYTQCWFNFERFLDPDDFGSYKAVPIAGTGLDQYKIRELTPEEYHDVYELPNRGVPVGLFVHDNDVTVQGYPIVRIPYFFPVSDRNYEQLFYTPTFFIGRPGSGKTNALKMMTAASLSCSDFSSKERPAFIFFDYEGQFSSLSKPIVNDIGDSDDKEIWELINLTPVDYNNVEVISSAGPTPSQFSFKELFKDIDVELKVKILQYFLRNLSEVTEIAFKEISRKIFSNTDPETYSEFSKKFRKELDNQTIEASKQLTKIQRQALIRTFHDDILIFFDQGGIPFDLSDLIKPGKVIVFDLKKVSKEKVILYVLLLLQKLKLEMNILKTPLIVVIDEAHEIFKNVTGSSKEARYYNLIAKFLAEIGSRGRKYRLGLWLASQRPQDLHRDIQKVIGTYFILGLNPEHKRWLTTALGSSQSADFILNLPNRFAVFKNSSLYRGKTHLLKLIKSPNIHRTFI